MRRRERERERGSADSRADGSSSHGRCALIVHTDSSPTAAHRTLHSQVIGYPLRKGGKK